MRLINVMFQGELIAINADKILAVRKVEAKSVIVLALDYQLTIDIPFESLIPMLESLQ